MDTVVRAQPRDIIALVWFRLGYRPRDSLALVALHGPRRRTGVVVRVDLPVQDPRSLDRIADRLAGTLRRAGATATVGLVIADRVLEEPPHRLVRALRRQFSRRDIEVFDLIGVNQASYRSLMCRDADCCPPGGTPLDEVLGSEVTAAHVLAGDVVADDEGALVADVQPDDVTAAASGASLAAAEVGRPSDRDPGGAAGVCGGSAEGTDDRSYPAHAAHSTPDQAERVRWWRTWTASFRAGRLEPHEAGGLARALRDPGLRDAVMVDVLGAPPEASRRLLQAETAQEAAALLDPGGAADFGRLLAAPPGAAGAERMARARSVLSAAARAAPRGSRADALATLAWLAWYAGEGARARLLAERAMTDEPAHSLAMLVDHLLLSQVPPPWAGPRAVPDLPARA